MGENVDEKKIITGMAMACISVMVGGVTGILGGYAVGNTIEYEQPKVVYAEQVEEEKTTFKKQEASFEKQEVPIKLENLDDLQNVLNIGKEIVQRIVQKELSPKDGRKMIYQMSSEFYKRNIPEEICVLQLEDIIPYGVKELEYKDISYTSENEVYVETVVFFGKGSLNYKIKLVKENNVWCFAALLEN